jgi:hypothetical protein
MIGFEKYTQRVFCRNSWFRVPPFMQLGVPSHRLDGQCGARDHVRPPGTVRFTERSRGPRSSGAYPSVSLSNESIAAETLVA